MMKHGFVLLALVAAVGFVVACGEDASSGAGDAGTDTDTDADTDMDTDSDTDADTDADTEAWPASYHSPYGINTHLPAGADFVLL